MESSGSWALVPFNFSTPATNSNYNNNMRSMISMEVSTLLQHPQNPIGYSSAPPLPAITYGEASHARPKSSKANSRRHFAARQRRKMKSQGTSSCTQTREEQGTQTKNFWRPRSTRCSRPHLNEDGTMPEETIRYVKNMVYQAIQGEVITVTYTLSHTKTKVSRMEVGMASNQDVVNFINDVCKIVKVNFDENEEHNMFLWEANNEKEYFPASVILHINNKLKIMYKDLPKCKDEKHDAGYVRIYGFEKKKGVGLSI